MPHALSLLRSRRQALQRLAAAGVLACQPSRPWAAHEGHEHSMGSGSSHESIEQNASAAFDSQGRLWVVHRDAGHIAVSRSPDLGTHWSRPLRITRSPEAVDTGGDARPKIAIGTRDEIYVTWTRPLAKPYTGEIRFARSIDGGASFTAPVVVHADRQPITHRFDSIAVNEAGQVFVAWIDKRDQEKLRGSRTPYRGAAVYWAVSDDRGASFRGDFKLADHSCECCRIALAPQDDGSVLAFWRHVFEPNVRDHALGILTADGRSEPIQRATRDDWRIDVCPHHGGAIARDAEKQVHAVWFTGAGDGGIFYGRPGSTGPLDQRRIGGPSAEHADIAASGNRLAIAWKEFDGRQSRLRALRSDDAGTNWRDIELAATAGPSGHPMVLVHRGTFHVFWNRRDLPHSLVALP